MTCVTISSEVRADALGQVVAGHLADVGVRQDLDDVAGGHGDEAVHLQDRQERLVELRPASSASSDSIVTCARTRGSRMKFLPVAALTASMICVMSASLKFGVMRAPVCCARCRRRSAARQPAADEARPRTARRRIVAVAVDVSASVLRASAMLVGVMRPSGAMRSGVRGDRRRRPALRRAPLARCVIGRFSASLATVSRFRCRSCGVPLRCTVTLALAELDSV